MIFPAIIAFRNIAVDNSQDQSSRWSSDSNNPPQVSSTTVHMVGVCIFLELTLVLHVYTVFEEVLKRKCYCKL